MRVVINRQDRLKAKRLMEQAPDTYFEVHKGNHDSWKIVGWGKMPGSTPGDVVILPEQYRMMVYYKIIDEDLMLFNYKRFKIVNHNLKFQGLYMQAMQSIEDTGKLPDGKSLDDAGKSLADVL